MCGWWRKAVSLLMLWVFLVSLLAVPSRAWAQSAADDSEFLDSNSDFSDDEFSDTGDNFTPSTGAPGQGEDELGDSGYVEESQVPRGAGFDLGSRASQLRRGQEGKLLPMNLAWGAATGLLIGGWLALLNAGNNRSNLQSIGTGIVVGSLIGIAVGARLTINPDAPVPQGASNDAPPAGATTTTPLVAMDGKNFTLGVLVQF
jgi:hypothetical protein